MPNQKRDRRGPAAVAHAAADMARRCLCHAVRQDRPERTANAANHQAGLATVPVTIERISPLQRVLLAVLWIAARPYLGIIHDARLYMVQALDWLHPRHFANDLYLAYGSQDQFTIFSRLYAPLIALLGPSAAHLSATIFGQICWFSALLYLTRSMFGGGRTAVLAAAGAILLNPFYGDLHIFSYGERFATPRLFAEALVMLAVAFTWRQRRIAAALCLLAGLLIHPLMTLPGIAVVALLAARDDRRLWLLYLASAVAVAILAAAGIPPFARLLMRFDPVWFATAIHRSPFVFVTRWNWTSLDNAAPPIAVVALAISVASPAEKRLLWTVAIVAAAGVVLALLGGDVMRDVLVANVQPWRGLWLLALMGNIWAGVLVTRMPPGTGARKFLLLALACDLVETWLSFPPLVSWLGFAAALLTFLWERRVRRPAARPLRLLGVTVGLATVTGLLIVLWFAVPIRSEAVGLRMLFGSGSVIGLALVLLLLSFDRRWRGLLATRAFTLLLLAGALACWDQRSRWQDFVEDGNIPSSLAQFVAHTNTIDWDSGVDLLWFKLLRPSYYSYSQGAGAVFFASAAAEYQRRTDALAGLDATDPDNGATSGVCPPDVAAHGGCPIAKARLAAACRALPELDAVVLRRKVAGVPSTEWRSPVPMPAGSNDSVAGYRVFHLYRCSDVR